MHRGAVTVTGVDLSRVPEVNQQTRLAHGLTGIGEIKRKSDSRQYCQSRNLLRPVASSIATKPPAGTGIEIGRAELTRDPLLPVRGNDGNQSQVVAKREDRDGNQHESKAEPEAPVVVGAFPIWQLRMMMNMTAGRPFVSGILTH